MATVSPLHKKPTARELLQGIKIIDVDTHVSEWHDLWTSRAPERLKHLVPRVVGEGGSGEACGRDSGEGQAFQTFQHGAVPFLSVSRCRGSGVADVLYMPPHIVLINAPD